MQFWLFPYKLTPNIWTISHFDFMVTLTSQNTKTYLHRARCYQSFQDRRTNFGPRCAHTLSTDRTISCPTNTWKTDTCTCHIQHCLVTSVQHHLMSFRTNLFNVNCTGRQCQTRIKTPNTCHLPREWTSGREWIMADLAFLSKEQEETESNFPITDWHTFQRWKWNLKQV